MKNCVLLISMLCILTGCGVTGDIREFRIDYSPTAVSGCSKEIIVSGTTMSAEAGVNQTVGAYNLGKFKEKDLEKINSSLTSTLEQFNQGNNNAAIVRVHFHRYAMSYSNDEFSILAIVDWSIEEESEIIFEEAFYAAYYSGEQFLSTSTLGSNKDKVNKAIVKHIADNTFYLLCDLPKPQKGEMIFSNPHDAMSVLPGSVDASPLVTEGMILPGFQGNTFFEEYLDFEKIDWENR